jgi:hypothetical protein
MRDRLFRAQCIGLKNEKRNPVQMAHFWIPKVASRESAWFLKPSTFILL